MKSDVVVITPSESALGALVTNLNITRINQRDWKLNAQQQAFTAKVVAVAFEDRPTGSLERFDESPGAYADSLVLLLVDVADERSVSFFYQIRAQYLGLLAQELAVVFLQTQGAAKGQPETHLTHFSLQNQQAQLQTFIVSHLHALNHARLNGLLLMHYVKYLSQNFSDFEMRRRLGLLGQLAAQKLYVSQQIHPAVALSGLLGLSSPQDPPVQVQNASRSISSLVFTLRHAWQVDFAKGYLELYASFSHNVASFSVNGLVLTARWDRLDV